MPLDVTVEQKIALKNKIVKRIEEAEDWLLMKPLFEYMLLQPHEYLQISDLPVLGLASFEEVCQDLLFSEKQISRTCLERMTKLMMDP